MTVGRRCSKYILPRHEFSNTHLVVPSVALELYRSNLRH
jgi:hypothetical protein